MTLATLVIRLAIRELRGGLSGFRIMLACLILGVTVIAGVGTVNSAVVAGLRADGARLLGGDIDLRLIQRTLSDEQHRAIVTSTAQLSEVQETRAMASNDRGTFRLVELKAVDDHYPLLGSMQLAPAQSLEQALENRNGAWGAVADANVLERLGVGVGDTISVGDGRFTVRGVVTKEPDRVASVFNLAPRLMIAGAALNQTGLVQPGSQIHYHYRMILPPGSDTARWQEQLNQQFPEAGWRIRTNQEAAPGLERFVERFTLFLSFVGLTALLVGGVGVGNASAAYLARQRSVIATYKCLGAPAKLVFLTYLTQILLLSTIAVVIGVILGGLLPQLALSALSTLLPTPARAGLYPLPLLLAAAFGLLIAGTFALWPLLKARHVLASQLFRGSLEKPTSLKPRDLLLVAVPALILVALILFSASHRGFAAWFTGGSLVALLGLRGGATLVTALARRIRNAPDAYWRLAIGNLHRPGNRTANVMVSLGLGLAVLVAVASIEGNLRLQIDERLPQQAPAFFFIDIQPDQLDGIKTLIKTSPGTGQLQSAPSLRGRIIAINGVPVEQVNIPDDAQWAVRGDRALTYAAEPSPDSEIVAGHWWPADYDGPPLISFDANLARAFGIGLNDSLTLNILGRDITAQIASLRAIDWRTLRFDFAIIFSPGVLETAPQTHLAAVQAEAAVETTLEQAVVSAYPNVSAIRVREALSAVRDILVNIGAAVRAAAAVTLIAGALVLAGAVAAGHEQRVYDAVVFKVLGATRRRILRAYVIEYGLLGLATGVIAAAIGSLTAWAVMTFLMQSPWVFLPFATSAVAIGCLLVTIAGGLLGTWRALGRKAAPLLRNA